MIGGRKKPFRRLRNLIAYRWRAAQIGVSYRRGRTWQLPKRMRFQGKWFELSTPGDNGSRIAFLDIFVADVYGLRKHRQRVQTVIDVGAHVGFFGLHARMVHPTATIHAYEPNPNLWPHLSSHASRAPFHAVESAIGLNSGRVSLNFPGDSVFTQTRLDASGQIRMISIRDAVDRIGGSVDLLKLDCEGAEWEILRDQQTLKDVRMIVMEYHLLDKHTTGELVDLLQHEGYRIRLLAQDHSTCGRVWADRTGIP